MAQPPQQLAPFPVMAAHPPLAGEEGPLCTSQAGATKPARAAGPDAPPPAPPASLASSGGAVDVAALKSKLQAQLRSLLEDDSFMTLLAGEYARQQQRALQQARQARVERG